MLASDFVLQCHHPDFYSAALPFQLQFSALQVSCLDGYLLDGAFT
jgi:hypothetical protein